MCMHNSYTLFITVIASLLFLDTGPVVVDIEYSRYFVMESSRLFTFTLVTSYAPRFSFKVKLAVMLGGSQTSGQLGTF